VTRDEIDTVILHDEIMQTAREIPAGSIDVDQLIRNLFNAKDVSELRVFKRSLLTSLGRHEEALADALESFQ